MLHVIGCNTVNTDSDCVYGLYPLDVYERVLKKYGRYLGLIGALEFSHVTEISEKEAEIIGRLARAAGFQTWSIHSEHLNPGDTVEGYLDIQKKEADICAALGCQVMVCHLPNLTPYVDFERDLDVIGRLAGITRSSGVKLAVETCFYPAGENRKVGDAGLVIDIVEKLDLPDVGINLDTGHCFYGQTEQDPVILRKILAGEIKQSLPDIIRRIGKKLFTTHLQDNFGMNDDHQAPGMGYIDWEAVLTAIFETGYAGPLMMEMTGQSVAARRTVEQLRDFPLEKDIVTGASYLNYIQKKILTA